MRFFALSWPNGTERPELRGDEPSFEDARAAWGWLLLARQAEENRFPDWNVGEYSNTVVELDYLAGTELYGKGRAEFGDPLEDWPMAADGTGWMVGSTPGVGDNANDETSDNGIIYEVVAR